MYYFTLLQMEWLLDGVLPECTNILCILYSFACFQIVGNYIYILLEGKNLVTTTEYSGHGASFVNARWISDCTLNVVAP